MTQLYLSLYIFISIYIFYQKYISSPFLLYLLAKYLLQLLYFLKSILVCYFHLYFTRIFILKPTENHIFIYIFFPNFLFIPTEAYSSQSFIFIFRFLLFCTFLFPRQLFIFIFFFLFPVVFYHICLRIYLPLSFSPLMHNTP